MTSSRLGTALLCAVLMNACNLRGNALMGSDAQSDPVLDLPAGSDARNLQVVFGPTSEAGYDGTVQFTVERAGKQELALALHAGKLLRDAAGNIFYVEGALKAQVGKVNGPGVNMCAGQYESACEIQFVSKSAVVDTDRSLTNMTVNVALKGLN